MRDFTDSELDLMFSKAAPIDRCDQDEWRLDASGAIIRRSSRGRTDRLVWLGGGPHRAGELVESQRCSAGND